MRNLRDWDFGVLRTAVLTVAILVERLLVLPLLDQAITALATLVPAIPVLASPTLEILARDPLAGEVALTLLGGFKEGRLLGMEVSNSVKFLQVSI
jgi:hypothetical protein